MTTKTQMYDVPREVGIGSVIWRFDVNHRVYLKDPNTGRSTGGPIYREHWQRYTITGETPRSWITSCHSKVPKKGKHDGWAFSESEVDDYCWVEEYRHSLIREVSSCRNPAILRKIAALIGYREGA